MKRGEFLRTFIREWGPVHLVQTPEETGSGRTVRRIDECLLELRWLQAVQRMIEACKGRADWRR